MRTCTVHIDHVYIHSTYICTLTMVCIISKTHLVLINLIDESFGKLITRGFPGSGVWLWWVGFRGGYISTTSNHIGRVSSTPACKRL